jgi:hypothetical protein
MTIGNQLLRYFFGKHNISDSRHTGLPGNTSGDDNDLGTLEGGGEAIMNNETRHEHSNPKPDSYIRSPHSLSLLVSLGLSGSVDVADISGNTGSTPDIVKAQSSDQRVGLEQ